MTPSALRTSTAWTRVLHLTLLPVLLVIVWQLGATLLATDARTPVPTRVATTFVELVANGGLIGAVLQSLTRVVSGFAVAFVAGTTLGILMGTYPPVRDMLDPIIESFRPLAPMAILPIVLLWFGTGTLSATAIVTYAAFFPLLINTVHGVSRVDRKLVLAALTMGVSRPVILVRVVLPAAMPSIMLGARLAMGIAWTAIIAAELGVGAKSGGGASGGIGQMMFLFYSYSIDLNAIVVCMIVVGIVALAIDRLFRFAERRLMPWRQ